MGRLLENLPLFMLLSSIGVSRAESRQVEPYNVYAKVERAIAELHILGRYLGVSLNDTPAFRVSSARPREVLFQANSFRAKAFKLINRYIVTKEVIIQPGQKIRPADVIKEIDLALVDLLSYKKKLGIREVADDPAFDKKVEPADVYNKILLASSLINNLQALPFGPRDIERKLHRAFEHLHQWTGYLYLSEMEPFGLVIEKYPGDIFKVLYESYLLLKSKAESSNLPFLDVEVTKPFDSIHSKDVYDFSVLLLCEIKFLHRIRNSEHVEQIGKMPVNIFYTHNFYKARSVRKLLTTIKTIEH